MGTKSCGEVVILSAPGLEPVGEAVHCHVLVGRDGQHAAHQVVVGQHEAELVDGRAHVARQRGAGVQVGGVQRQQVHVVQDQARELVADGLLGADVVQHTLVPQLLILLLYEVYPKKYIY